MTSQRFLALWITIISIIGTACQEAHHSSPHGFPDESNIWNTLSIPVCWENPETRPAAELEWVREAVASTWERWSQLKFTGWGTCSNTDRMGIRIYLDDAWPRALGLGSYIRGLDKGVLLNHSFKNWGESCTGSEAQRQLCIRSIAVHEFGHALGFSHEHNRDDRPPECTKEVQGSQGSVRIGAWDLNSVMNYCSPIYNNNGQLSKTDILTVQYYYGRPNEALITSGPAMLDGTTNWTKWPLTLSSHALAVADGNFKVSVHIDHPNPAELVVYLQGPDGTWYLLHNKTKGNGNGIRGVYPDTLLAASDLNAVRGKALSGTWTLWVQDAVKGNAGRINRFGISDYLPEAYLLSFKSDPVVIDSNRFNSGRSDVVFEHSIQSLETLHFDTPAGVLANKVQLLDGAGQVVPVSVRWEKGNIKVGMLQSNLKYDSPYTLTLRSGPLAGFYTIDKDYSFPFVTPKRMDPPPTGGFGGGQILDLAIPDADTQGIVGSITVDATAEFTVSSHFRVYLDMDHPYSGDLRITLVSPRGTEVLLHNEQGSADQGFRGYFPDQYKPFDSLAKIKGEPLAGTWTLKVIDKARGDMGVLKSWRIEDPIIKL